MSGRTKSLVLAGALLGGLYYISRQHYLLFHSLAEMFSIAIACAIFIIGWNSRQYLANSYLLLLGIAYLFVAGIDLLHTLAYRGMGVFAESGTNRPTQLWIAARFLESLSLVLAPALLHRKVRARWVVAGYTVVTAGLVLSIFGWDIFPACFVEGRGLTPFKVASEYAICLIVLVALALLWRCRAAFEPAVVYYLAGSMVLTIASELAFTLYHDAYGIANLVGHYLKIISFYLVYRAIVETGFTRPYALLFRDLKDSEQRYRALFTHMINGVARHRLILDAAGQPSDSTFLEVNDAFARMLGLAPSALVGKRVTEVIPGLAAEPPEWIERLGQVVLTGKSARFERYATGLRKWYSVIAYCPEPGCFVTVLEDITQRKCAEAALQEAQQALLRTNEVLEQKVRERTAELQETVSDLEQFSYSIVHDMRAPLRSMNAFSNLVLEDCTGKLDPENVDYLKRIASAARRLDNLIQDVLTYSKVARTEAEASDVNLDHLIDEIVRGYPCFHSDQARIEIVQPLLPVRGNPALLTLCISNLLGNAIKFVAPGTRPEVRISTEANDNGTVKLAVRDNGIGIDPRHLNRIWRIFERLHHPHEYPGTGIGLSVVKRAAERMNGKVGADSQPGAGSTFWLELPSDLGQPGPTP